jgi:hypothetical protein
MKESMKEREKSKQARKKGERSIFCMSPTVGWKITTTST